MDWHICIMHSVQCQEYRIQNFQFRKRRFTCVWLDWILSFHSSERGKFSFPVHGNNTRTRPKKNEMPETQEKHRRCNRWKPRDWEISCQPALPPSLKLPGGDLTKPRAGTAGLPLNISFLLKPNFRHSCIPLFKRKNVKAAVMPSNPPANSNSDPCWMQPLKMQLNVGFIRPRCPGVH